MNEQANNESVEARWGQFASTGRINDYMEYRSAVDAQDELSR